MNQALPENPALQERAPDFKLTTLLTMSDDHYQNKVWPLMFYISRKKKSKWQMNAARALGNLGDTENIPVLITTMKESPYEEVRAMCGWALGRLSDRQAREALEARRKTEAGVVRAEMEQALETMP